MARASRARVSVDLQALAPAVAAAARARDLTVPAFLRLAASAMFEGASELDASPPRCAAAGLGARVKVTIRVASRIASAIAGRAAAMGISHGGYVAGLVDGVAPPPPAADLRQATHALAASTDQLATLAADVSQLIRLAQQGAWPSRLGLDETVRALTRGVRNHLRLASRLLAALQPRAVRPGNSVEAKSASTP